MRKIKRHISREGLISRIPGFFPYLDPSDGSIHKATDALNGCYNQIPLNLWDDCFEPIFGGYEGDGVPYRIIMDAFYKLSKGEEYKFTISTSRPEVDEEDSEEMREYTREYIIKPEDSGVSGFLEMIENGIGKLQVPKIFPEDADLVPGYVYLAQIPTLVDEYHSKSILCEYYQRLIEKDNEKRNATVCCTCDRYKRMGGDKMLHWLQSYLDMAERRAEEWLKRGKNSPNINFGINLTLHSLDMGTVRPAIAIWQPQTYYYEGQIIYYQGILYKAMQDGEGSEWKEEIRDYVFREDFFEEIKPIETKEHTTNSSSLIYRTNSKLKTCRRPLAYINAFGEEERPAVGEDWLYYYRVGQPVNIEYEADANGNLVVTDGKEPNVDNLLIYGDLITAINADKDKKTITFNYVIGGQLKLQSSTDIEVSEDDDKNKIYRIKSDAKYIFKDGTGVRYEESYIYTDEDTIELIEGGDTVEDNISDYVTDKVKDRFAKYPFITSNSQYTYEMMCGMGSMMVTDIESTSTDYPNNRIPAPYGLSNDNIVDIDFWEATKDELSDERTRPAWLDIPYIRDDYNLGVGYSEKVKSDVFIRRGVTNVFERHFKLAEIKTLEDMENYANGGFFNMQTS